MLSLKGKTFLVTGASRGIGKAIAVRLAAHSANIGLLGKTVKNNPKLPGTLQQTAEEIKEKGASSCILECDIRDEKKLAEVIQLLVKTFGGIDGVVNNAGAIYLAGVENVPVRKIDLMFSVNVRAALITSQYCLPYLKKSSNPHILNISPPLQLNPKWFKDFCAYSISKYGMSLSVLGMAEEFRKYRVAVNALWPRTTIATAAIYNLLGGQEMANRSRSPEIMAEAALRVLSKPSEELTGQFLIDEAFLREEGITDFSNYAIKAGEPLQLDFFVEQ